MMREAYSRALMLTNFPSLLLKMNLRVLCWMFCGHSMYHQNPRLRLYPHAACKQLLLQPVALGLRVMRCPMGLHMLIHVLVRAQYMSFTSRSRCLVFLNAFWLWCTCFAAFEAAKLQCRSSVSGWVGFPCGPGERNAAFLSFFLAAFSIARKSRLL